MSDNGNEHQGDELVHLADIRVRFDTGATDVLPLPWAEAMLQELRRRNHTLFGQLLVLAATGEAPPVRTRASRAASQGATRG